MNAFQFKFMKHGNHLFTSIVINLSDTPVYFKIKNKVSKFSVLDVEIKPPADYYIVSSNKIGNKHIAGLLSYDTYN